MKVALFLTLSLTAILCPAVIQAGEKAQTVPATGLTIDGTLPAGDTKITVLPPDPKFKPIDLVAKLYEVNFEGGKSYTITMDSKEFDSFVVVQDKTGKQLAFDDDGGGDLNSRLQFSPAKGDTFKVYAAALNGQGKYTLKITTQEVKVLEVGADGVKVNGELTKGIKSFTYHVTLNAGKTYVIDMLAPQGSPLDPYLRLDDPSGKELAKDDDGGELLNARITFSPPVTARYQIVATSFLGAGAGQFTLMVKEK